ncbi:MAG TPA: decaprenyl-phosphate phosphoribosyltransferase [Nocardioides sp.]|uniref:decaprenyl-phosphate phosphoribosyltransferase n=1 Tax=uncultured Nocardioides sp. TaxID=198441 RepID=UPI0026037819|nr:decaprenyl-phosphate phosphoribosyltransferase [uncultured Nocardioides sp.]HRI98615.1 decaprenyl-phosphate phosphoribosyltransferase [Nocardioides sp.]
MSEGTVGASAAPDRGVARALVRAVRPRQWVKNLLVVAAPLAAGELGDPDVLAATLLALVGFCLASGAVYLVNDTADRDVDRLHPTKRLRPIASGALSVPVALTAAAVLAVAAVAVGWAADPELALLIGAYLVLQLLYAVWLKHEPVLDISIVAAGFLMRAVAGGIAADLLLSQWFLLVSGFGSLFIVAGKRYSELHTLGSEAGTRRSLVRYTDTYLRFVWSTAAGATVISYSLWAFEQSTGDIPWATISIAPFLMGLLRYAVDVDAGTAAEPEDIVFRDRVLQLIGLAWLVTVCLGVLSS